MNAWDLTKDLLEVMADIDRAIEQKTKTSSIEKWLMLDAEVERLEKVMFQIIGVLKTISVNDK